MSTTYGEIWKTLSKIDCRAKSEEKQGMTYLSWSWAWGILMEHYPSAEWVELPEVVYPDGTVAVGCMIRIGECNRTMRLPVMDHRNKPIANPDAWMRNKADMRCMVKALALFGLGHYIYAGEDLPTPAASEQAAPVTPPALTEQQVATLQGLLDKCPEGTSERFLAAYNAPTVSAIDSRRYDAACKALRERAQ